ncbi:MAG: hypothetical protein JJ975_09630 [Bacteroidia bacterium]|nr:hypothetical protein [Bacteroidia bacterium]
MKIRFSHWVEPDGKGGLRCYVRALGEEVSFVTSPSGKDKSFDMAEAHIIVKRLRVLLLQRNLVFSLAPSQHRDKMKLVKRLQQEIDSVTLVPASRLYAFIVKHRRELLSICPNQRTDFNVAMEELIVHAMATI